MKYIGAILLILLVFVFWKESDPIDKNWSDYSYRQYLKLKECTTLDCRVEEFSQSSLLLPPHQKALELIQDDILKYSQLTPAQQGKLVHSLGHFNSPKVQQFFEDSLETSCSDQILIGLSQKREDWREKLLLSKQIKILNKCPRSSFFKALHQTAVSLKTKKLARSELEVLFNQGENSLFDFFVKFIPNSESFRNGLKMGLLNGTLDQAYLERSLGHVDRYDRDWLQENFIKILKKFDRERGRQLALLTPELCIKNSVELERLVRLISGRPLIPSKCNEDD